MEKSFLCGLVLGCVLGGFVQHYIFQCLRRPEKITQKINKLDELNTLMNDYPIEMGRIQSCLNEPENNNKYEFFVIEPTAIMNSSMPRLRIDLSDSIIPMLHKLEHSGFIEKLPHDSLLYKMSDQFIQYLKQSTTLI